MNSLKKQNLLRLNKFQRLKMQMQIRIKIRTRSVYKISMEIKVNQWPRLRLCRIITTFHCHLRQDWSTIALDNSRIRSWPTNQRIHCRQLNFFHLKLNRLSRLVSKSMNYLQIDRPDQLNNLMSRSKTSMQQKIVKTTQRIQKRRSI